jgi:hypothetical protein
MFSLEDSKAEANGARKDDIRGNSLSDAHRQDPRQPAVRGLETHKNDQPDTEDAQPKNQQTLQ